MAGTRNTRAKAAPAEPASGSDLSPAPTEDSPEPPRNTGPGLKFAQELTWRAGRPIPVGELIKRLQRLQAELREMDQVEEEAAKQSFTKVCQELSSEQLLAHKDRGVRAWAASCAVDVLRLCAPDAPFSERELKAVFETILKSILPALSDPSNPYNGQHMYVLQSLAHVKSIVLVTDLPSADAMLLQLFESFFDVLSGSAKSSTGEQVAKQAVFNMTTILVVLVEELPTLPQDVVDTIMAQFLRVDSKVVAASGSKPKKATVIEDGQSTLEMKELPPAYTMAKTICNSCADKMSREVSKYFGEVIMEVTSRNRDKRRDSGDAEAAIEDATIGPSEEDMQELAKAHRLMRELWRACPAVLQNVIPQLEAELGAENVRLRLLATETLGDMIAGIGAAGPPAPPNMDPATYPPPSFASGSTPTPIVNLLTVPAAPQSFAQTYSEAYQAFLNRENDKAPVIRAARATGVGRILATSAGGVGLGSSEEKRLAEALSRVLNDSDERVRLAAVRAIASFGFRDVVSKLGSTGSVDHEGSVLSNLSARVKDKKHIVREEAMYTLAKIWAAGTGEIAEGNEQVIESMSGAASKILNAFYTNDQEMMVLIDTVLFEVLVPLRYPPIKSKATKANGSQRVKDSQALIEVEGETRAIEPDKIRAERILVLANGLDERAKKVFLSFSNRQVTMRKYITAFLQACEQYNAGVMDKDEATIKSRLAQLVENISKFLPNPIDAAKDLQKFAKLHDRRNYQLLRFSMAPESDYRTVYNAIKEFRKRIEGNNASAPLIDTFMPLIYRSSILLYNKSHIPFYLHYARTDEKGLASIAHEVLTEVSQRSPEVLKANVSEICHQLQEEAPTATKANSAGAVDSLKACAAFARKFTEEIPQDTKFVRAMTSFAMYGTPPDAAKHAVSIIMAASKKKEMLARDLVQQCVKGFEYGKPGFLARLATLSRLCLQAPTEIDDHFDAILDIATKDILLQTRHPSKGTADEYEWTDEVDEECLAKCWALRILVNRIRAYTDPATLAENAAPVYDLLIKLVENDGELSNAKNTPPSHKPRLRLIAARSLLKLCLSNAHNNLLEPQGFQALALVAQDPQYLVRSGFLQRLKKYLGQNRLSVRFYTIPFLLAYEPELAFRNETVTWIRSRVAFFAQQKLSSDKDKASKVATTMESVFPRLLHLLAHHPDYGDAADELHDFARYLVFFVTAVATRANVSLIYHVAQRVKTCTDALQPKAGTPAKGTPKKRVVDATDYTGRLYALSDLATLVVRAVVDAHGWALQTLPVRLTLPRSLFAEIKDHDTALDVAGTNFLPDAEVLGAGVDKLVRAAIRKAQAAAGSSSSTTKKRKSEADGAAGPTVKRARGSFSAGAGPAGPKKDASRKPARRRTNEWDDSADDDAEAAPGTVTAKAKATANTNRRTSGRASARSTQGAYAERADSEDDEEMEAVDAAAGDASSSEAEADAEDGGADDDVDMADEGRASPAAKATPKKAPGKAKANQLASPFRRAKEGGTTGAAKKETEKEKALPERKAPGRATRTRG